MAPEITLRPAAPKKRKEPPHPSSNGRSDSGRGRAMKRNKTLDARSIMTQTAEAALKNGDLDLQSFLNAREYEIKALEDGMQKSKGALSTRAFQQVPRDMRRRTASHNVKRIPKRLQKRGVREMKEDNTPTVNANKRKPGSSRSRVRAETAKKLGILANQKRAAKGTTNAAGITTRAARPKIRKNVLNDPPKPPSKFRKRQIHKTWLPTHLWHAKRAKMTEPKEPLWRMAIPLNSTEKSYRPTHRAGGSRGAVAWDMSYMSTIGLKGLIEPIGKVLLALGIPETDINAAKGAKWRAGKRSWNGWLSREVKEQKLQIGPAIAFWDIPEEVPDSNATNVSKKSMRQVLIRIHPSAFLETWTELLRLSKLQHPAIQLEDLRFEIGSIEITGPGSTEALIGILHPYYQSEDVQEPHAQIFTSLAGVTNPASLPANSILSFSIMDPRLRYPPRKVELPDPADEEATFDLMEKLSTWPADRSPASSPLFDRDLRYKATRLPSQKALNRRKTLAPPGTFPSISERDPSIPVILLTSRMSQSSVAQGSWTLLAPWKCILPIWYGLMHFPLSSGGNPRFGGLQELRQMHFEHGIPWFPADYPGTNAGYAWEVEQREKRKRKWDKRPKGKKVEWKSLDLGGGRKGELGLGWACDFENVAGLSILPNSEQSNSSTGCEPETAGEPKDKVVENPFNQLSRKTFSTLLSSPTAGLPAPTDLATIRLTLLTRGVATPTARIYRLPAEPTTSEGSINSTSTTTSNLRQEWLSLIPAPLNKKPPPNPKAKDLRNLGKIPFNTPLPQRVQLLAKSLLQDPPLQYPNEKDDMDDHPIVPDEGDLVGFVTTGEYNLAEGKGIAVGTVFAAEILKGVRSGGSKEVKLCIMRNAGETVGRLARWDVV
ncbi:Ribonucleases P/MRP protein subunit pop1 [Ciborinia camelliae]|nr:Ribonucleases P/MRP protein subunit pop1 [Ciborinia camelliae]